VTDTEEPTSQETEAESAPTLLDDLRGQLWPLLFSVPLLTVATGLLFPAVLAALAYPLFRHQSEGSLVSRDGRVVGSELVGQRFSGPGYFHSRPSAAGNGYDATASGGSNLGPLHPKLRDGAPAESAGEEPFLGARQLTEDYRRRNELSEDALVPIDAVTRSGSGLDPHISPANAALQVKRIARVRGLNEEEVRRLVDEHTQGRQLGFLGEPCVNVLSLNLALDRIAPLASAPSAR
jgi:K+-transporting ATPase ATPase C chain